jgi:hypothetical protein
MKWRSIDSLLWRKIQGRAFLVVRAIINCPRGQFPRVSVVSSSTRDTKINASKRSLSVWISKMVLSGCAPRTLELTELVNRWSSDLMITY